MPFGTKKPFSKNPFAAADPVLVKVPEAPETHERRKPMRAYLAGGSFADQITTALSPLLPGAPRPSRKVEVERIREVAEASTEPEQSPGTAEMPRWGRG